MRFDLPDDLLLVNDVRVPIRWGDMDAMGHVNNTVYFRYLEIGRVAWFDSMATPVSPGGQGPVIVNTFCNFLRQLAYPGEVVVRQYVHRLGRSSIDTYATVERADQPGVVYASGGAKVVWLDQATGRSTALPEAVRARFPGRSAD